MWRRSNLKYSLQSLLHCVSWSFCSFFFCSVNLILSTGAGGTLACNGWNKCTFTKEPRKISSLLVFKKSIIEFMFSPLILSFVFINRLEHSSTVIGINSFPSLRKKKKETKEIKNWQVYVYPISLYDWCLIIGTQILKRETALATAAIYDSMFAAEDGTIPATFQVSLVECTYLNNISLFSLGRWL